MLYVRFPHSLRNVEDLLDERGIDVSRESVPVLVEQVRSDVHFSDPAVGSILESKYRPSPSDDKTVRCGGFRQRQSQPQFASVHSFVKNHFNLECNPTRRDQLNETRTAAHTVWRPLGAVYGKVLSPIRDEFEFGLQRLY